METKTTTKEKAVKRLSKLSQWLRNPEREIFVIKDMKAVLK